MNIGIDIDDTISDTFATLLECAQKYTIEELKREPVIDKKELTNHLYIESMHHWNKEEALEFWKKYYAEILEKVNIKTYAAETIKKFREKGNKVFLITARWDMEEVNTKKITLDWLKENDVEYDDFIMNAEDKLKIIKDKQIDVFIDDSIDNCKKVAYASNVKVYIMDTRVNENFHDEKIKRAYSWPHVYSLIEENMKEEKE